jgi:hypothetical protein
MLLFKKKIIIILCSYYLFIRFFINYLVNDMFIFYLFIKTNAANL